MDSPWHPLSWEGLAASQQPEYEDKEEVNRVVSHLKLFGDPIVCPDEIEELLAHLTRISLGNGKTFLHAGDCAETFVSCNSDRVNCDVEFLSDVANRLGGRAAEFVIGRICGQFGKPRSSPVEHHPTHGSIPVFRGDIINSQDPLMRGHDPTRMIEAHFLSKQMKQNMKPLSTNVYISHECLLLSYESALVRQVGNHAYNTSAHFLWIGDRTRDLDGAHVEFCRGLRNPIGIKVSHTANPSEIVQIINKVNPDRVPGKITIITRFGASNSPDELIRTIRDSDCAPVVWQCDPMHGNTIQVGARKTRRVEDIKREIAQTIEAHQRNGTRLHGVHLETTGADVTECVGCGVQEEDLHKRNMSACDPRLNPSQTRHVLEYVNELCEATTCSPTKPPSCSRLSTNTTASASPSSGDEASIP